MDDDCDREISDRGDWSWTPPPPPPAAADTDSVDSILTEFGWNLQQHGNLSYFAAHERSADLAPNIGTCSLPAESGSSSAGLMNPGMSAADVSNSIPSVSSSSSEDLTEKSTESGGKPPEIP